MGISSLLEEWIERIKVSPSARLTSAAEAPLSRPSQPPLSPLGALWFWLRLVSRSELSYLAVGALTP